MLNLEWFRTFKVVYETGNLTAAARVLYISQPGASLHLSSLETYVGHSLFHRGTRKLTPTEKATMLYNSIIDHVNKLEEAEKIFHRKPNIERATVRLGMSFELFKYTLEASIAGISFNLNVRFGGCEQLLQELTNGMLDIILTPQTNYHYNIEFIPFLTEQWVLICGGKTNTEKYDHLQEDGNLPAIQKWLAAQTWYSNSADMEYLKKFWILNFDSLPEFKPNYVLPSFDSILRCLSDGNGFSLLPDFLCKKDITDGKVKLALIGSSPVENILYFGARKNTIYSDEIKELQNILYKNCPPLPKQLVQLQVV